VSSAALQIVPKDAPPAQDGAPAKRKPIRFGGRSFMALVLSPDQPVAEWLAELDELTARSPGFFGGRPVVLDVSNLRLSPRTLATFLGDLEPRHVKPIGVGAAGDISAPEEKGPPATSLVIDHPVRSGQSIAFQGDVTICGSVASGAEIVASGSIHVYGALRGRAIAGSNGDPKARIFCRRLDAELLAIDGVYMTTDELDRSLRGKAARAWIENDTLRVAALD